MESNLIAGALNVATTAAREAGKVFTQNITQLDRIKVNRKTHTADRTELVSEIDLLAERTIIHHLESAHPDYNIISEEAGDHGRDSEYCWIIDPLDGTHNFLHGHPHCCVSIALKHKADIVAAVVYDAFRNELFTARKGGGAQLDGRRIRVSETSRLSDSLLCTGFPYREGATTKLWLKTFAALMPRAQSVHRTGSSVLDLAYVACGRYDGFWEFGLQDWDIAAGALLVKEAGGLITDYSGSTDVFKSGNVVAGTPRVHEKLQHMISHLS
ncbi:inositol monophosphatase family protein [Arenicella xantha]|uniref:Inositol-1-monophosphatase n=1 Tax=Arenicella xantha TaxID=644221 RepID=A0A395JJQ4_9GAMM|nr:inositol monophosphatase family protein [Arenicella xantha]RBP49281.1 myo-inositol-1(or 4)-monophosphatase [Arenicella xantha]